MPGRQIEQFQRDADMNFHSKHIGWLGFGALWAILSGVPAMADDTELFVGVHCAASMTRPNILFIIDNSGSMDTDVRTQPTYDPNVTYAGSCSATRIYWRTGTGNPPACSTDRWFNQAANQCNLGALALGSAGFFIDTMAQYDTSSGSGGRRWETISSTQKDRLVECQDDNGLHGDGNPLTPSTRSTVRQQQPTRGPPFQPAVSPGGRRRPTRSTPSTAATT
jgi:type IV pilus assembly protein PilY1